MTQLLEQLPSSFLFPTLDSAPRCSLRLGVLHLSRAFLFYKGLRHRKLWTLGVARGGEWGKGTVRMCWGPGSPGLHPCRKRRWEQRRSKLLLRLGREGRGLGARRSPTEGSPARVSSHRRQCAPGPAVVRPCSPPCYTGARASGPPMCLCSTLLAWGRRLPTSAVPSTQTNVRRGPRPSFHNRK